MSGITVQLNSNIFYSMVELFLVLLDGWRANSRTRTRVRSKKNSINELTAGFPCVELVKVSIPPITVSIATESIHPEG